MSLVEDKATFQQCQQKNQKIYHYLKSIEIEFLDSKMTKNIGTCCT